MGMKCTKDLNVGYGNHETGDILLVNDDNPTNFDLVAIEFINNLIRLKRGMSMFKLYGGHAEQKDPQSAEEGVDGAIELLHPALPAENIQDANLIALDENARFDHDFNYDFS
jgi:hypothetical protein